MIVEERMAAFINSLDPGNAPELEELEAEARRMQVPVIRRELQSLLKTLLALQKPGRILEVGTAIGFSALFMSEYAGPKARITTIENYEKRIPMAQENFRRLGKQEQIQLLAGDAREILPGLSESYDFVFMDAAKGQYIHFLPEVLRLLKNGGLLVSDNVLQEGTIVQSRYGVERRDRTIHGRMREYLYRLKHMKELETAIVPVGDGVALSVLKDQRKETERNTG